MYPKTKSELGYKRHSPYKEESNLLISTPTGRITMKEVDFPLLGIGKGEVQVMHPEKEYQFKSSQVLEIPLKAGKGSKLYPTCKCGCKSEFNPKIITQYLNGGQMAVLDHNGEIQMKIEGGERIFSRIATKKILDLSENKDYEALGLFVVQELKRQDNREPEYVKH